MHNIEKDIDGGLVRWISSRLKAIHSKQPLKRCWSGTMHNVEKIIDGELVGWISSRLNAIHSKQLLKRYRTGTMHNVEKNIDGELVGWISGRPDGCPSSVVLSLSDRKLQVFATRTRVDVLRAGHTLLSGFHFRISTNSKDHTCQASLEGKVFNIKPSVRHDADLIKVDKIGKDHLSGWINSRESILSLSFFGTHGIVRAEVHKRNDVNDHLKTPSEHVHGFSVKDLEVSGIYALVLNNELVHFLEPGWLAKLVE